MRKLHSANRAIYVLESPWGLDDGDANRTSVLPFIEGVAKYAGDIEVMHANFYDTSSFKKALACLARTRYQNAIVYIAAHGSAGSIGGVKTHDVLSEIGDVARRLNVTGALLGACLAGHDTIKMEVYTEGTNLRWCGGYSASVAWLEGTLLDCSILSRMLDLDEEDFSDSEAIVDALADAVAPFSRTFGIGAKKALTPLDQSIEFVAQAKGRRAARTVTEAVFAAWARKQA